MKEEQEHFEVCKEVIRGNIERYKEKIEKGKKETEDLHAAVASGDMELYNQLVVSKDILFHNENMLRKNRAALEKPYFGRVDYTEEGTSRKESLYIGKNGVSKNRTEVLIVDWRAPVSTLYYENELGCGSYFVPESGEVRVDLNLKRTFDVSGGKLLGYYDNDTAATDELLVKYLSQNKDVVLSDIISTIQKEQNEIIRESPYTNVIVQGVAGSGKTTVAMHRISYILYNYENRFAPSEFCIIGGNDMLLGYITSGLPELDVHDVRQKRMDMFLQDLVNNTAVRKKYKYTQAVKDEAYKSRMEFVFALEEYLGKLKCGLIPSEDIVDEKMGVLLSGESIGNTLRENPEYSVLQLQKLLNERLQKRIVFLLPEDETEKKKALKKQYRGYFKMEKDEKDILKIYDGFLRDYQSGKGYPITGFAQDKTYHVYDLAALALILKRMAAQELIEEYGQIIIDEAQDFGSMVYYVLKQVLYQCHFTIMGDVSQNINYETGMNSWKEMKEQIFAEDQRGSSAAMQFHILAKSYRNTIEISEYAGKILEKASFGAYKITPVIRHGREVAFYREGGKDEVLAEKIGELVKEIKNRGFDTAAVICRNEAEAEKVRQLLHINTGTEEQCFSKGMMVLPIQLTKGLEFDTVILWNPDEDAYGENEADAKLLYVAVTRALHELHIVYKEKLSKLFET